MNFLTNPKSKEKKYSKEKRIDKVSANVNQNKLLVFQKVQVLAERTCWISLDLIFHHYLQLSP